MIILLFSVPSHYHNTLTTTFLSRKSTLHSYITAVRKELTDMREKNKILKDQLDREEKKVEQTQQKYLLADARLEDSRTREEGLMNKFTQISKSMDELKEGTMKAAQVDSKVESGSSNITAADVTQLMDKLTGMTAEVGITCI